MARLDLPLVRVKALAVGRLAIYNGGRRTGLTVPIVGYVVAAGSAILVFDCGLAARWATEHELHVAPDDGPGAGSPYVPELTGPAMAAQLAALGLQPDRLVCSHLHIDHGGGAADLSVPLEAAPAEIARLRSPDADALGYPGDDLATVRTIAIELDTGRPVGPFPASVELAPFGVLVATPGHTPGSISLLAQTAGGPVLLCGDAPYPRAGEQRSAAFEGMLRLRRATDNEPTLRLLPGHDTAVLRASAGERWL